ncbi:transglutaminase domain-containing protein [Streptomyces sp. H021]|uniref:transglutaminase domain-containing protein n=1 Tax=Streptomyces sp. H021 TaxID=1519486 RepID=UPI000A6ABAAF|nr:transglutaminase domain-containing protein [Streptomyces sp. H021]
MTSSLLRPRGRIRTGATGASGGAAAEGSTAPTRILDWRNPRIAALVRELGAGPADAAGPADPARQIESLHRAHAWISGAVGPVYSVQDERPVSEVLRRGRGSCSQRLAVLEAVARAYGVPTRVRGLLVDGSFWYPRFPRLHRIVPDRVLLAWPEFRLAVGTPRRAAPGGRGAGRGLHQRRVGDPLRGAVADGDRLGRRAGRLPEHGPRSRSRSRSRSRPGLRPVGVRPDRPRPLRLARRALRAARPDPVRPGQTGGGTGPGAPRGGIGTAAQTLRLRRHGAQLARAWRTALALTTAAASSGPSPGRASHRSTSATTSRAAGSRGAGGGRRSRHGPPRPSDGARSAG